LLGTTKGGVSPLVVIYSRYSTCLAYLIAFIKRLPHNKNIKGLVHPKMKFWQYLLILM